MKRLVIALAAVAVLAVGTAAVTFAQTPTPGQTGWGCWGGGANGNYDPADNPTLAGLAEKLGMSAADLSKELQAGKSVAEVAKAKNVELKTLVEVLQAPQLEMLKWRVEKGYLTQEQADAMQKYMAERTSYQLEQKGGFGYGWGRGGMMGPGFGGMMGPGYGGMMGPGFGPRGGSFGPGAGGMMGPRFQGSGF